MHSCVTYNKHHIAAKHLVLSTFWVQGVGIVTFLYELNCKKGLLLSEYRGRGGKHELKLLYLMLTNGSNIVTSPLFIFKFNQVSFFFQVARCQNMVQY